MPTLDLSSILGNEISDTSEETFTLFSQSLPSNNLGFVDPKAPQLQLTVAGRDYTIRQSPTVLSSNRAGGTTGSVVWQASTLLAEWLAWDQNWLFRHSLTGPSSAVVELGCGVSGIVAVAMAPRVKRYICTDQEYVFKLLRANLEENAPSAPHHRSSTSKSAAQSRSMKGHVQPSIDILPLDWEKDVASDLFHTIKTPGQSSSSSSLDLVIACDCIYNESLIGPFVRTCTEICQSQSDDHGDDHGDDSHPTMCLVAQQLRSDEIFDAWLSAFSRVFRVWRIPDNLLTEDLRSDRGFAVHVGILKGMA